MIIAQGQITIIDINDKAVESMQYLYAVSSSNTVAPTGGWQTTKPSKKDGEFIWSKLIVSYTTGDSDEFAPIPVTGDKGENGKDAKSLRISADKTVFALNSLGEPYPNQVATVNVVKQNIAESHRISGWVSAPDNATEFKVTPQMMGYEPIEVKRYDPQALSTHQGSMTLSNGVYTFTGTANLSFISFLFYLNNISEEFAVSNIWLARAKIKNLASSSVAPFLYANSGTILARTNVTLATNEEATIYSLLSFYETGDSIQVQFRCTPTDTSINANYQMSDITIVPVTELLTQPKLASMTDAQKLEWLNTYIPTIGANSTWTIGGKAKNYAPAIDSGAWVGIDTSSAVAIKDGYLCATASKQYGGISSKFTDRKNVFGTTWYISSNVKQNTLTAIFLLNLVVTQFYEKATSGFASCVYKVIDADAVMNYIKLQDGASSNWEEKGLKEPRAINLTASGWLAQLSLMGIEGNANVKNWLDTYIPFFEGEMDFPRLSSATIKAEAGGYEDYLTIQAISQNRSIQLIASPSEIELDSYGEANTDSVTIKAQKNNIFGNLKWSNNRGLPVVAGDEQSFVASQMGLKPIKLTRLDKEILTTYNKYSFTESNGVYTFTGNANLTFCYLRLSDNGISDSFADSNIWFGRAKIKNLASSSADAFCMTNSGSILKNNSFRLKTNEEAIVYALCTFRTGSRQLQFRCTPTDTSVKASYELSEITFVPVTELLAHPKFSSMTDAQKLEWLNTYIPTIKAGESWTVGGKAKNLLDNPTSSDGWTCGSDVTGFSASNGIVTGTTQYTLLYASSYWIYKEIPVTTKLNDSCYVRVFAPIVATAGYELGCGYNVFARNQQSGLGTIVYPDNKITVGGVDVQTTVTIDTTKGINVLNLTSSGWLAQLSLMGIEGADNVKAWIDANVPFFVGEFDFPAYRDVTWTAEYEEVSASVTVGAKKTDFKIESSHESYALSPRGVCKNRQTITFHVDALGLADQPSWRIYYDGEVVEQDIKGNTISWTLEINESPRTITAEVTSGKYYDILTLNAMVNGNPMPERVTGGYSSRMIPQDVIRSIKALDDGVSPLIEGDYALVAIINNEGKTEPTPYRYSGVQWIALNGNESNASEIFFALQNDAWATDDTMATASIIIAWIKNLISQNAFIENLKIKNEFSSTNYEEDANGMPVSGWKGDTKSGTLKSYQMVSHGMEAYNAKVQGSLEHDALKTVDAKSGELSGTWADSTKTHWSFKSLMEGVPRYTGAAGTYHNSFRSGSITYNGETYDQYYSKMWKSTPESQHTYTYTKHLGKASGGHILGGGESGESVSSIASRMGITLQSNDAVRLNFHCSGATTRFDCYINGQLSYSEKVDGVGVFNGWLRPSDIVRIYCYNSNIFNERDLTCTVTLYQVGYPMQPLTTAPSNLGPGVPADIGEDGEATTKYAEKSWTVPTGKLINQAWVSFNADVYGGFDTFAELYVNGNVIASFNKNTDWYKINWKATVKGGDTITLRVYSIRYPSDPSTYYYCNAYGVMCAFGYVNDVKGLYLQQSSGNKTLILPFYAESEPAGWTDKSISTSLATVTKQYLIGDKFISTLVTAWGSANMNKELICTSSKIIVDGVETAIDRVKLTNDWLSYRTTAGVWKSIVKLSKMGLYESLSLTVATLDKILSIETASVVPKMDSDYQIGTPTKHYGSSYIKEHHINGWRMAAASGELTFIYEG